MAKVIHWRELLPGFRSPGTTTSRTESPLAKRGMWPSGFPPTTTRHKPIPKVIVSTEHTLTMFPWTRDGATQVAYHNLAIIPLRRFVDSRYFGLFYYWVLHVGIELFNKITTQTLEGMRYPCAPSEADSTRWPRNCLLAILGLLFEDSDEFTVLLCFKVTDNSLAERQKDWEGNVGFPEWK